MINYYQVMSLILIYIHHTHLLVWCNNRGEGEFRDWYLDWDWLSAINNRYAHLCYYDHVWTFIREIYTETHHGGTIYAKFEFCSVSKSL